METSALPLIWRSPCICSWQLSLIYLHISSICLVLPVKYILCFYFFSAALICYHSGSPGIAAGKRQQVSQLPSLVLTLLPMQGARTIFFKPMTTHVTHLIKTFQWLSISLKIQARVLKTAYKSEHDLVTSWLSDALLVLSPGPCWPLQACWPSSLSVTMLHACYLDMPTSLCQDHLPTT